MSAGLPGPLQGGTPSISVGDAGSATTRPFSVAGNTNATVTGADGVEPQ